MSDIDVSALANEIKTAATASLGKDVTELRGFSERQVEAIAKQAGFVGTGIATGQITEGTRDYFLDSIEDMTMNFLKTLRGLVMATIENVWNAIVGVIWKAINAATNLNLPVPS